MEEGGIVFKILTGTPIGKIPLGRPRHRWEEIIEMDYLRRLAKASRLQKNHNHY